MEFVTKGLLGGFQSHIPTSPCILCKDGSAGETKEVIFLEVLGDGCMHLTKVASVALIKDDHQPLLEDRVVLVLLDKDGEFLDGGDNNPVIMVPTILVPVLQLPLEYCCGGVSIGCTFLKPVVLLHCLVVQVFSIHHKEDLVYVRKSGCQLCSLEGGKGLS